ncbi:MAG: SAV_6107 family HEPN domain-containing protein [Segniliparus sp.]|uniref:SAV_6107 family HEPN domain-containing protein n=1 Tax=Segniliparus sp. TaxID=2804064 RepID=UPI003F3F10DD
MKTTRTFGRGAMTFVRGGAPGLCGELLGRADARLFEAMEPGEAAERFLRAYQAALGGAGALLVVVERPGGRRADRSAWARLAKAPGFELWAQYFHKASKTRALAQAGSAQAPTEEQLHEFVRRVGEFLCEVEDFLRASAGHPMANTRQDRKSA